jgi:hypothetical protein
MILAGTGPAGGEGISDVARVTYLDIARGFLTHQDPKQFLFFTRTPGGIRAGKEFLARSSERARDRDKEITVTALQAQLKALRRWGSKEPADLCVPAIRTGKHSRRHERPSSGGGLSSERS